jgi:uncharacterized membrane protein YqjE
VINTIRRIGKSLVGLVQNRVALLSVELQEERLRTLDQLLWFSIAAAFGLGGIIAIIAAVAALLWQSFGWLGLVFIALACLFISAIIVALIRRSIKKGPQPFAATMGEFQKDMECFRLKK